MRKVQFVVLWLLTLHLAVIQNAWAGERFQPRGCEFSVEFPDKPKIYDVIIPGLGNVQNAEYVRGDTPKDSLILVVEGYPIPENAPIFKEPKKYLLDGAQNYAKSNGIQNAEFKYVNDKLGFGITMRGFKVLNGVPVIYSTLTMLGKYSMITLRVGSASEVFPPPDAMKFLKSLR